MPKRILVGRGCVQMELLASGCALIHFELLQENAGPIFSVEKSFPVAEAIHEAEMQELITRTTRAVRNLWFKGQDGGGPLYDDGGLKGYFAFNVNAWSS